MTKRYAIWLAVGIGIGAAIGVATNHNAVGCGVGTALGAGLATAFAGPQQCDWRLRGR